LLKKKENFLYCTTKTNYSFFSNTTFCHSFGKKIRDSNNKLKICSLVHYLQSLWYPIIIALT